jgi:superfamily I DNA/RNA helicase
LEGRYSRQLKWVETEFLPKVDLENETVAFLKPRGGKWFEDIRKMLDRGNVEFVELTRRSEWPKGAENVALCTMHSAKGLEFDHVIILGLNQELTPHGKEDEDSAFQVLSRLFAMACGRARESLIVGYKPEEASTLIGLLDPAIQRNIYPR